MAATKRNPLAEERAPDLVSEPAPPPAPIPVAIAPFVPPPPPDPNPKATFRVWPHGTLQHNGKTYAPGDTIVMRVDDAAKVPCLVKVDG